jgi:DNA repair protein RecO (recombination protein O)
MPTYKTTGLVLRRHNLGEADRIITFLTPQYGKIRAVARGVRRIKSRMAGHLELFCDVELMLAKGRNLDVVTSARLLGDNEVISRNFEHLSYGYMLAEMLDKLVHEDQAQPALYQLAREFYVELAGSGPSPLLELYYKLRLLDHLGYHPGLDACAVCGASDPTGGFWFNPEHGGIVDDAHAGEIDWELSVPKIKLWRQVLARPWSTVSQISEANELAAASLPVCDGFYDYLFGARFKSKQVLNPSLRGTSDEAI